MNLSFKPIKILTGILGVCVTLPVYRGLLQSEYEWGLLVIRGVGKLGDYGILITFFLLTWATYYLENWYKKAWYYLLPILLYSILSFATVFYYFYNHNIKFKGDALGIDVNLGLLLPVLSISALIYSVVWSRNDFKMLNPKVPKLPKVNKSELRLIIFCGLLTIGIFILFGMGNGKEQSNYDRAGVLLAIVQCLGFMLIDDRIKIRTTAVLVK